MARNTNSSNSLNKVRKKRPGIHSKSKNSRMKHSVNYKKKNVGQGR